MRVFGHLIRETLMARNAPGFRIKCSLFVTFIVLEMLLRGGGVVSLLFASVRLETQLFATLRDVARDFGPQNDDQTILSVRHLA
jgi:hypothetical protein